MDSRPFFVAVGLAIIVVLAQNGFLAQLQKQVETLLIQNYLVGWFVLPALIVGYFLYRRGVIATNQILSPEKAFKTAMLEKGDDFLKKQYAMLKQFYRPHPRVPYFVWDANKENALGIRTFIVKSKRVADSLGLPLTRSVAYFVQQAPKPAGNRIALIGSPIAVLNLLGANNLGQALSQSVGYSQEQKALEQFERIARESDSATLETIYGQIAAQGAARSLNPTQTQGAK